MLNKLCAATLGVAMALPAMVAADGNQKNHYGAYGETGQRIVVSCYRGPWKDVIWDRPNTVFIESLVAVGYDYSTANAIGERVCRDSDLVDNPEGLKATMRQIWKERGPRYKR
ncbi:MAG: hypothetical protein WBB25_13705 [Sulfitobacter sp.]